MQNFIIPSLVEVGYQKRHKNEDSFLLGFITYKEETGIRKFNKSWEDWRDNAIAPQEFENIPTSGFILDSHSGRRWGHFEGAEFVTIIDPRGFEFQVSIDNLMMIICHNGILKGNLIQGELVFGWDYGKRKVSLIPVTCEEYAATQKTNEATKNMTLFDGKITSLVPGTIYKAKSGKLFTYLGKFKNYRFDYCHKTGKYVFILSEVKHHIFHSSDTSSKVRYNRGNFYSTASMKQITHSGEMNENFDNVLKEYMESPINIGLDIVKTPITWELQSLLSLNSIK